MENNVSSTKDTVMYQLFQPISSGVITLTYSYFFITVLPYSFDRKYEQRRAAVHNCAQLQKKVKLSLLQNVHL